MEGILDTDPALAMHSEVQSEWITGSNALISEQDGLAEIFPPGSTKIINKQGFQKPILYSSKTQELKLQQYGVIEVQMHFLKSHLYFYLLTSFGYIRNFLTTTNKMLVTMEM